MSSVLIIEDHPVNMKVTTHMLRMAGHTVLQAFDAESGLKLARAELPDIVLMDITLPGMDGLAATALLKNDPATAAIPVIALTGMMEKSAREKCLAAGCDAYIAKPENSAQLLFAVMDSLLLKRGAASSSSRTSV